MEIEAEVHPFQPFLPENAKLLMLGTFPPARHRWSIEFYYPNFINDMWRIFGIIFFADKNHFVLEQKKCFKKEELIAFLKEKGIALFDTAYKIKRTKNTASDKDLDVIETVDFGQMLRKLPLCRAICTTGQLATELFASYAGVSVPKVGEYSEFCFEGRLLRLYRMPSSSRAYPMQIERKAEFYNIVFKYLSL